MRVFCSGGNSGNCFIRIAEEAIMCLSVVRNWFPSSLSFSSCPKLSSFIQWVLGEGELSSTSITSIVVILCCNIQWLSVQLHNYANCDVVFLPHLFVLLRHIIVSGCVRLLQWDIDVGIVNLSICRSLGFEDPTNVEYDAYDHNVEYQN